MREQAQAHLREYYAAHPEEGRKAGRRVLLVFLLMFLFVGGLALYGLMMSGRL